jgi:hypothetical protein
MEIETRIKPRDWTFAIIEIESKLIYKNSSKHGIQVR